MCAIFLSLLTTNLERCLEGAAMTFGSEGFDLGKRESAVQCHCECKVSRCAVIHCGFIHSAVKLCAYLAWKAELFSVPMSRSCQ